MSHPAAETVLRMWESGQSEHPLDRALSLLAFAQPERGRRELAALSIGRRDAQLLDLRERWFGPRCEVFAECAVCGEALEFAFDIEHIRETPPGEGDSRTVQLKELSAEVRAPNSFDLAAALRLPDEAAACEYLLRTCTIRLAGIDDADDANGAERTLDSMSEIERAQLAAAIGQVDPQAEVLLELHCPACGSDSQRMFDIGEYLWQEIQAQAREVLDEIHRLARYYGWREADILAMSARRRKHYLNMIGEN